MISKFSGKLKSVLHIRILKSFILYFLKNHKVLFFMVSFFSNLGLKSLHCKYFVFSTTPLITKEQHFERKERCGKHGKKKLLSLQLCTIFYQLLSGLKAYFGQLQTRHCNSRNSNLWGISKSNKGLYQTWKFSF